jgi:hypothetical protein
VAVKPRGVVERFQLSLRQAEQNLDTLVAALPSRGPRKTLEGVLSEQFALELGVRWEGFIHDLLIAYLVAGRRAFLKAKRYSIKQNLRERFGDSWTRVVHIGTHRNWTPRIIETLIDPKQRNLTFTSADKMYERATELLGSRAIKFSLDPEDRQLVNFVLALRNYLAHRSKASSKELSRIVAEFPDEGPNAELSGTLGRVASYLRNSGSIGRPARIRVVYARMIDIVQKLA